MEENIKAVIEALVAFGTIANTLAIMYIALKKLKPEVKKLENESNKTGAEVDSEIVSAAHTNLEGAEISTKMLVDRIRELREDLENEKRSRRDDAEYFRRRFREAEREARDYRQWAARLAKQVIEAGKVPVAFTPSFDTDSEQNLKAITKEEEDRKKGL